MSRRGILGWNAAHARDFDCAGRADLIWHNAATGTTSLWLMNGGAALSTSTLLSDPSWSLVPLR